MIYPEDALFFFFFSLIFITITPENINFLGSNYADSFCLWLEAFHWIFLSVIILFISYIFIDSLCLMVISVFHTLYNYLDIICLFVLVSEGILKSWSKIFVSWSSVCVSSWAVSFNCLCSHVLAIFSTFCMSLNIFVDNVCFKSNNVATVLIRFFSLPRVRCCY